MVPCAPVVEVKIKRPDTKYQLGFSVQNGVVSWNLELSLGEKKNQPRSSTRFESESGRVICLCFIDLQLIKRWDC